MFTATKDKALQTTTTGSLPRPGWYTENLRGQSLSRGFSQRSYREQHFDCLAANVAAQYRAGIDIMTDGDTRLDDDVAGRSWVSYACERIEGIGAPRNTPVEIVTRLNSEVNAALADPVIKARLADLGSTPRPMSPQAFEAFIAGEIEKWAKVIRAAKITLE